MAAQYQFVMRSGPTVGKVTALTTPEVTIGRETSNTITINDAEVSRRHAKMELHGSAYVIEDLGSTNGTFVNGKRITGTQVLNAGDVVSFGETIVLVYESPVDQNATVISSKPAKPPTTKQTEKPAPPAPAPTKPPTPAYSGRVPAGPPSSSQVPAGPVPMPEEAEKPRKKFPIWVIVVILLVVVICGCIGFFLIIDQFSLWCKIVPFLVPILGGTC